MLISDLVLLIVGWANSLEAGHINESFDFAFFRVHISLTEAGQGALPSPRISSGTLHGN